MTDLSKTKIDWDNFKCRCSGIHKEERPKEIARRCPNCGELHWDSELNHTSVNSRYKGLISTLYGVCKRCADIHAKH